MKTPLLLVITTVAMMTMLSHVHAKPSRYAVASLGSSSSKNNFLILKTHIIGRKNIFFFRHRYYTHYVLAHLAIFKLSF